MDTKIHMKLISFNNQEYIFRSLAKYLTPNLLEFGQAAYANYDLSHDWGHALQVTKNLEYILDKTKPVFPNQEGVVQALTFAAMLHDANDHKYKNSWTKTPEELKKFLDDNLCVYSNEAFFAINNSSWSKRKNINDEDPSFNIWFLRFIRAADWIEALSLQRCIDYQHAHGHRVPEDVIMHIDEKLLHVYDELWFDAAK